jgi:hypothetical protein
MMTSKLPAPAGHEQWYTAGRHTAVTAKTAQRPVRPEKPRKNPRNREITAGRHDAAPAVADTLVIPV